MFDLRVNNVTIVRGLTALFFLVSALAAAAQTQELPRQIRGYKVHREVIRIDDADEHPRKEKSPNLRIDKPEFSSIAVTGIKLAVKIELRSAGRKGRVEMLIFQGFQLNGLTVEINDYSEPFEISSEEPVDLPVPVSVFVPTRSFLRTAWAEATGGGKDWHVTGRIFVLGRFRHFGFLLKRAVPIDVALRLPNPLPRD